MTLPPSEHAGASDSPLLQRQGSSPDLSAFQPTIEAMTLALANEVLRKHRLAPMASLDDLVPAEREGFVSDVGVALVAGLSAGQLVAASDDQFAVWMRQEERIEEFAAANTSMKHEARSLRAELVALREAAHALLAGSSTWLAETSPGMHINTASGRGRTKRANEALRCVLENGGTK